MFWLSACLLGYTYVGYPVLLWLVGYMRTPRTNRAVIEPTVTVIISARNEEKSLAEKLENTLSLDYPKDKLEIIVVSDCSTDRTDEIASTFAARGVILHRQAQRLGKTAAQNAAVRLAKNDIILFSDATTFLESDVLRAIVPNFADPQVGCVSGRLIYSAGVDTQTNVTRGANSYWKYESLLKRLESRAGSLTGASGCLYAVRRSAYIPLYNEACSDFVIATKMCEQGLRTVYEPTAVAVEDMNSLPVKEMRMRVRIIAQTYTDLWRNRQMLNPLRAGFFSIQLISHKLMRYAVAAFLLVLICSSLLLAVTSPFYAFAAAVELLFLLIAAASLSLPKRVSTFRWLAWPAFFALANAAAVAGFYKFLRGHRYAHWEPMREPADPSQRGKS